MNMHQTFVHVCVAMLLTLTTVVAADTMSVVLDQSQETSNAAMAVYEDNTCAQTFVPGVSGTLDHIDVNLGSAYPNTVPVTVSVVETAVTVPSGDVLGSVCIEDIGMKGGWITFDFHSQSIALTDGTLYGIVVAADEPISTYPGISWGYQSSGDPYTAGACWWNQPSGWMLAGTGADAAFKTYMVPEPTTALLLGVGGLVALVKRRTRRTGHCNTLS